MRRTPPLGIPFGDPRHLLAHQRSGGLYVPTRQDPAIVICGGGDPHAEAAAALDLCAGAMLKPTIFLGNDMIAEWPGEANFGCSLHPEKLLKWTARRLTDHKPTISIFSHRPFTNVNHWTRDWAGSTGLFCVKIARELGFTHIILCGVHMSPTSDHFVRRKRWDACDGFKPAWVMRLPMLSPYLRSYGGWTKEQFGEPDQTWLLTEIADEHRQTQPPTWGRGPTA